MKNSYSTEKRAKIIEYLSRHKDDDVSVRDIESYIKEDAGLDINVTTIYRYLEKLEKDGKVLKHVGEGGNKATYQFIESSEKCHNHLHMKCNGCGKIYHMDCSFMMDFQRHIYEHHKFVLECKTSMLYGTCQTCRGGVN